MKFAKRRARFGAVVVSGLAAALLLSSCAGNSDPGQTDDAEWASFDPETVSGEITHWTWGESQEQIDELIAQFNEVYPDVEVTGKSVAIGEYTTGLGAALASGEGPDTYNLEPGAMVGQFGPLSEDLTPLFANVLGDDWESQLAAGAVGELTIDDRVVGAPNLSTGSGTFVVNLGLLEDLGVDLPDEFQSVEELVSFCEEVTAAGKQCLAMGAKDAWISQDVFHSIANSVEPHAYIEAIRGERSWEDPAFVEAFDIWQSLFSNGVFQEGALGVAQYPDAANLWQSGGAVAIATGTWAAVDFVGATSIQQQEGAGVADPEPLRFTITRFPGIGGNPVDIFSSVGSGTAINSESANKSAAAAWVSWYSLATDGPQSVAANNLVGVPSLVGIEIAPEGIAYPELADPSIAFVQDGIVNSTEPRQIPYPDLSTALGNALQSSATGVASADVTRELQTASEAVDR